MPWKCPACAVAVTHYEYAPQIGQTYRCPACRLELQFDPTRNQMILAPLAGADISPVEPLALERRNNVTDRRRQRRGGRRTGD
jgi:hypothetical protein